MASKKVISLLGQALASTYVLSLNTQKCHWNITGPNFHSLHLLFEKQYDTLSLDVDGLAEYIRSLDCFVKATLRSFAENAVVDSLEKDVMTGQEMISFLAKNYEQLLGLFSQLEKTATQENDVTTADLAIQKMQAHQKTLWMLKSSLGH